MFVVIPDQPSFIFLDFSPYFGVDEYFVFGMFFYF